MARLLCLMFIIASSVRAEPPRIGVIFGETGAASRWARAQREGIELAAELLGSEAPRIIFEDSGTDAKRALSALQELVSIHNVDYIIGDIFSTLTEALIPAVKGKRVILVSPSTPASTCREDVPNYFTISAQVGDSLPAWKEALAKLGVRRIAAVYLDNPTWGALYRTVWGAAAAELNVQIVDEFANTDLVNTDFDAVLPHLLQKQPEAVLLAHSGLPFLRALRRLQYRGAVISANHVLEHLNDPPPRELLEGVYVVDSPVSDDFRQQFEHRFGHAPVLEPQTSYEAVRSIARAAKEGRPSLRGVNYRGVAGDIDFRSGCAGNRAEWRVFQIARGKLRSAAALELSQPAS
jgi:ABC-type branched-subunit amino acid transport system substrate-binding protein